MRLVTISMVLFRCHSARHPATSAVRLGKSRQGEADPTILRAVALTTFLDYILDPFLLRDRRRHFSSLRNPAQKWARAACLRPKMSTDAEYEAFLERANQDASNNVSSKQKTVTASQSTSSHLLTVNTAVPTALQDVEEYYMSDADEPFEPVSLKWSEKSFPSVGEYLRRISYYDAFTSNIVSIDIVIIKPSRLLL